MCCRTSVDQRSSAGVIMRPDDLLLDGGVPTLAPVGRLSDTMTWSTPTPTPSPSPQISPNRIAKASSKAPPAQAHVIELPIFCSPSTRASMSSQTRRLRSLRPGSRSLCLTDSRVLPSLPRPYITAFSSIVSLRYPRHSVLKTQDERRLDQAPRRESGGLAYARVSRLMRNAPPASGVHPIVIPYNSSLQLDERASSAR
ncbi:hypothetical protein DFH09DRAFT_1320833 [Mycena vulgaris]|nr:hypothetical protein DFH09DRAFT_1320833 [Mycena vulgaris]